MTCPDCKMTYTGQTGRPFKTRFKENMRDFKYKNRKLNSPNTFWIMDTQ